MGNPQYTKKGVSKAYKRYLQAEADRQGITVKKMLGSSDLDMTKAKQARLPFKAKKNLDVIPRHRSSAYGDGGNGWL